MSTPTIDAGPGAAPDRVERIRRRLIWALLGPFCILMSVSAVAGSAPSEGVRPFSFNLRSRCSATSRFLRRGARSSAISSSWIWNALPVGPSPC